MKGVMFTSKDVTEIIDEPEPGCGEDEVLLKTLYSGISNGTERSFLTGGAYGGQKWPNGIRCGPVTKMANKDNRGSIPIRDFMDETISDYQGRIEI
ncbi:MAG: hypothetical protein O7G87_01055 [bacterium]|nr:hypothetical protein [bacterium]